MVPVVNKYTSDEILNGILNNDQLIVKHVYDLYFFPVSNYIVKNGGTHEDAWDVFQDSIMVIYEQVKAGNLKLSSSFFTYLYSICKYRWLKIVRDNKSESLDYLGSISPYLAIDYFNIEDQLIEAFENEKRSKIYWNSLKKLSKECQKLLKYVFEGLSVDDIKFNMAYKSVQFVYKKRRICKESLKSKIESDPLFNNKSRD